jgi:hypothetical protein
MARVIVDIQAFERSMKALGKATTPRETKTLAWKWADGVITDAVQSPVPRGGTGDLGASGVVQDQGKQLAFGFNKSYAQFQDKPDGVFRGFKTILPKVKRILYIPLTSAGRRKHQYGANPEEEGLVKDRDYILRPRARIPMKRYGSHLGPNLYFSETLRRKFARFEEDLATLLTANLEDIAARFRARKRGRGL